MIQSFHIPNIIHIKHINTTYHLHNPLKFKNTNNTKLVTYTPLPALLTPHTIYTPFKALHTPHRAFTLFKGLKRTPHTS